MKIKKKKNIYIYYKNGITCRVGAAKIYDDDAVEKEKISRSLSSSAPPRERETEYIDRSLLPSFFFSCVF